jgi:hypothetical protein
VPLTRRRRPNDRQLGGQPLSLSAALVVRVWSADACEPPDRAGPSGTARHPGPIAYDQVNAANSVVRTASAGRAESPASLFSRPPPSATRRALPPAARPSAIAWHRALVHGWSTGWHWTAIRRAWRRRQCPTVGASTGRRRCARRRRPPGRQRNGRRP